MIIFSARGMSKKERLEKREEYFTTLQKGGYELDRYETAEVYVLSKPAVHCHYPDAVKAEVYTGSSVKAEYKLFRNPDDFNTYVSRLVEGYRKHKEEKVANRKKNSDFKASDVFKVGDILYSSWGYNMTNVDFYEVVALKPKSIVLRPIAGRTVEGHSYSAHGAKVVASPGSFTGDEFTKRVNPKYKSVSLNSFSSASLWDGNPLYERTLD